MFTEDFKTDPYWWDHAPLGTVQDSAEAPPARADVVVIGSGYAGLHAAIVLARAGVDVVVLDAGALGFGASSRNGGMVSGGVNVGKHVDLSPSEEQAMLGEASLSYSWFEDFIKTEKIDADYQRTGRFVGAHCAKAWDMLTGRMKGLNEIADSGAYMVPPDQTRSEIGSDYYHGGMVLERSGAVHPGKLHTGVLRVARDAGVRLFGNVRAGAIARTSAGALRVEISRDHAGDNGRDNGRDNGVHQSGYQGHVTADKIIIATNGYTGNLSPWHQRRLVPIASYQIATEELGREKITELFPRHRMIADTKRLLYYFRPSPDRKRILFGGRARYLRHDPVAGAGHLRRKLIGVFPELADIRLSHGWWGYVAYLRDGVPNLGESQPDTLPGVYHALGCHGSGVVMMSWIGYRTGMLVAGMANSQSAFSGKKLKSFPAYQGWPWFLPAIGAYYNLRDWAEMRFARK